MIPKKVWGKDPWAHKPAPAKLKPAADPEVESQPVSIAPQSAAEPQRAIEAPQSKATPTKEPVRQPVVPEVPIATVRRPERAPRDVVTDAEFEEMVERAIERIPEQFAEAVENCAFIVEAEPPKGQPGLLGLYRGHPLTSRAYYAGNLPDTITIYQGSLMRLFPGRENLERQVYRTVVHEIGHYFGLEEHELEELGWA